MASKVKSHSQNVGPLVPNLGGGLPLWDEAQIHQENWGGNLGLLSKGLGAVVEFRNTEGRIVVAADEGQQQLFMDSLNSICGGMMTDVVVNWRRPVDIFAPFRPIVHRNVTPFLSPYDKELKVFDSKAAEEAAKSTAVSTGKKSDARSAVPPLPLHVQFPEIVRALEPDALEVAVKEWTGVSDARVIKVYRELQPLMQAYDPVLELGCAATPAEACELGYSTAVRHRLKEVDDVSKLLEPPPFLMDAFNSALKFIEHAQTSVKNGEYLWELVYPHAPGTCHPVYNPYGKYSVRLFIEGAFRQVVIDDYLPVDVLGRPFFSVTSQKEIWPALLAKALFVALGSHSHLLFTDPETIVSCLRGGWVPQRIDPRIQPAAACALLLAYHKDLSRADSFAADTSNSGEGVTGLVNDEDVLLSKKEYSGADEEATVEATSPEPCENVAPLPPTDKSVTNPLEFPVVCAVSSLFSERRKLFIIHNIVFFRNTLAIRISTNPPMSFIQAKELTEESEDEMVKELLCLPTLSEMGRRVSGHTPPSMSTLWVTYEELSAHLDLVVWRNFDELSPFRFSSQLVGAEEASSAGSQSKKKNALPGAANTVTTPRKRNTVRWIHVASEKFEQLALVSLSGFFNSASSTAPQKSGLQCTSLASRPVSAQSCAHSTESKLLREDVKEVVLDLYTWERGDTLSHIGVFIHEPGKLQCMVHTLPPGSHILRVTAVGLEPSHVLSVLCTQEFIMSDEKGALSSANIFRMTDAGNYMGVERPNEEVLWFKRLITVKEPTTVSFIVSTLDSNEDPANHRDIPVVLIKDSKGTKSRVVNNKVLSKEAMDETPPRSFGVAIMSYCRLVLMDLDKGTICTGAVGRLVRQRLEPNQQGYLVMAYALIDSQSAVSLEDGVSSIASETSTKQRDTVTFLGSDEKEDKSSRDKPVLLCDKGLWKLTLSADRVLDSYKPILQNVLSFVDEGQLKRDSNALLFAYVCTVFERTSFTLLLDVDARDHIPFQVKVTRNGCEAQPIFVSDICTKHLFLPHVTLDLTEKAKKTVYVIEAWLDKTKVQEWEEQRRLAQQRRFQAFRSSAERKAMERYEKDMMEYMADPRAFIERIEQQNNTTVEHGTSFSTREPSFILKKGRPTSDIRKNYHGGVMPEKAKCNPVGSMLMPESSMLFLDAPDDDLTVSFNLRLHFSSRVEVKNGAPPKDPLASLRTAWVTPADNLTLDHVATSSQRGTSTKVRQRDVGISADDLLRADQGRMSRQRFLDNPRNILTPYLVTSEEGVVPSKEAPRAGAPRESSVSPVIPSRVVTDPLEETNYVHAPILSESQYRIQILPIRAVEMAPPSQQTPPSSACGVLPQRSKSPMDRFTTRAGAVSQTTDEDQDILDLKAPLQDLLRQQTEELKQEHDKRVQGREDIKNAMRQYWSGRRSDTTLVSLLGSREDEGTRRRGRVRMTN